MNKFYITILGLVSILISNSASAQKIFLKADILTRGAGKVAGYLDYAEISKLRYLLWPFYDVRGRIIYKNNNTAFTSDEQVLYANLPPDSPGKYHQN